MNKVSVLLFMGLLITALGLQATKGYVLNGNNNNIVIFDGSTDTVTVLVSDPGLLINASEFIAVTPDGTKAYVVNNGNNTVSIINVATDTVTGNVTDSGTTFHFPFEVAITPDGTKAYVANSRSVSVIDVATDTVTGNVTPNTFNTLNFVIISPDGTKAYVLNQPLISIVNVATNTVTGVVNANGFDITNLAYMAVFSPDGTKAYVINPSTPSVLIIDVATDTIIGAVTDPSSTFNSPYGLAITPDGTKLYVSNNNNTISVVNTATETVIDAVTVLLAEDNFGITMNPEGTKLYIPTAFNNRVNIVTVASDTLTGMVTDPNTNFVGPSFVSFVPLSQQPISSLNVVTGCKKSNVFLTQTEYFNVITWQAQLTTPVRYDIFRDAALTDLAGSVGPNSLQFTDHNRKSYVTYTYYVVAVYPTTTTFVGSVTITKKCARSSKS